MRFLPLIAVLAALLVGACESHDGPGPMPVVARLDVEYARAFAADTCAAASGDPCFTGCAHHLGPAPEASPVALWEPGSVALSARGPDRFGVSFPDVPVAQPLRLYVVDRRACCVDPCAFGHVTGDVFANGVRLERIVREGLPSGVAAALEFRVDASGRVTP